MALNIPLAFAIALIIPSAHAFSVPTIFTSHTSSTQLLAHARTRSHTYQSTTTTTTTNNVDESTPDHLFQRIDTDGNGKIDAEELCTYLQQSGGPYTSAVAKSIFERLDTHRNGHLQLEELVKGMQEHNLFAALNQPVQQQAVVKPETTIQVKAKKPTTMVQQQRHNTNNNKRRHNRQDQKTLYYQQAKRFFETLDVNHDGFVSLTELKEHFLVKRMETVAQKSGLVMESLQNNNNNKNKASQSSQRPDLVAWHSSEAALHKLFQMIDRHDKGRITLQDLREAFVRYPSVRHAFQA